MRGKLAAIRTPPAQPALFPDHRDIYLLVVGVLLGVLFSPAGLGNVAPDRYDRLFGAARPLSQLRRDFDAETMAQVQDIEATGVTEVAVQEHLRQRADLWQVHVAAHRQTLDGRAAGWLMALLAAAAVVMVLEAVFSPQWPEAGREDSTRAIVHPAYRRLVMVRYALLALMIALVIARPTLLAGTSLLFIGLVVAVALAAGLMPLGPRR